ncbi:hypothetical protein RRG08_042757 [Elysia crispata]|uniref:Adenylyltransferase and sulfurtransferase MOCS3 homolog n=1 Tax=Elysia crispata TaxID=231223 RepID=A0AAE1CK57_9GAST|nr:hypothetical protein RRG08_042757 [Elysia crispata]
MEESFSIEKLQEKLKEKIKEVERLKHLLKDLKESSCEPDLLRPKTECCRLQNLGPVANLTKGDIERYSRQLILPEFGVKGQVKLQSTSVLIVGAGGLGCPAAVYLAAAGIGRLGVVDYDEVELSNLHRQILHTSDRVGLSKSLSIVRSCYRLNSNVEYVPYHLQLSSENALGIIKQYDIVLDATDNVATRYLLNDACVLAQKPLVSGSALRFEGQLTVYNNNGGPCYRCLFPQPPPPESVTNCSEGGVIGVVPGIIGSMQALEAIKIASGIGSSYNQRMLLFDALDGTFRSVKLRPRSPACIVCGNDPSITQLVDYVQFCGSAASDKDQELSVLDQQFRINVKEYQAMLSRREPHLLLDVRPEVEMDICQLPHSSLNIPFATFNRDISKATRQVLQGIKDLARENQDSQHQQENSKSIDGTFMQLSHEEGNHRKKPSENDKFIPIDTPAVVCVCRRGNDSQVVVKKLQEELKMQLSQGELDRNQPDIKFVDIKGGLHAWARHVDSQFPIY